MERFKEFASSVLGIFREKNSEDSISHKQNVSDSVLQFPELDNLLEGFQIIGFDYKYLYLNNIAVTQSHLTRQELLGRKFLDVWPGTEGSKLFATIRDTLENRNCHLLDNEFIYPDNTRGWFELRFQPVLQGIMILSIDKTESITARMERDKIEEELRSNEEVYRTMFSNNPQPMWIYDLETLGFLEVNEAAIDEYGYSKEEFLSMTLKDIRPPEDISALLKDVAETEKSLNKAGVWRHLKKNMELIYVTIASHSVRYKGREARHVIANNVTEQIKSREKLLQTENRLKEIIWDLQVGVILQGPDTEIIMSNPKALEFLGLTEEQLLGKTSFDPQWNVIHEDGSPFPGSTHPVALAISGRKPVREVVMGVYRPVIGDRIWLLVDAFPQLKEDGTVRQVVCSFNNITDRKKTEENIRILNETLEQKVELRTAELLAANKELEAFSYSVSHDLRAPLRSINGFARILMDEYAKKLDDEGKRLCSIIMKNSTRMGSLIDDLLSFSRLSRVVLKRSEIKTKEMVNSAFAELMVNEDSSRIDFHLSDICNSAGDPILIKQVWMNLLSNAIKYSSKNARAVIHVTSRKEGDNCIFSVKDNGVGFDMAYRNKLFGVFQRLHSQKEFDGTGVGLAIVQRIIHRHGGMVWATSDVGRGAEFSFSLPLTAN
jgi:PAS domain S-box-containing protein